jgi:hypothetical protein
VAANDRLGAHAPSLTDGKTPQPTNLGSSFAARLEPLFLERYLPKKPGNWVPSKAKVWKSEKSLLRFNANSSFWTG